MSSGNYGPKPNQLSNADAAMPVGHTLQSAVEGQSQGPPQGKGTFDTCLFFYLRAALRLHWPYQLDRIGP